MYANMKTVLLWCHLPTGGKPGEGSAGKRARKSTPSEEPVSKRSRCVKAS